MSSSWGNGHATLWRGLGAALGQAGHRLTFFERDVPYYAQHRDLTECEGVDLVLYPSWDAVRPLAERLCAEADVAMVTSYCPDALAATELVLSSRAQVRSFYDLDTGVTLARAEKSEPVEYIGPHGLEHFDLVLSYVGGRALDELRTRFGARQVAPLYGSVDPRRHSPAAVRPQSVLSYLGTYAADRQEALERLFIEPARRLPHESFLLGGSMYPQDFPWQRNILYRHHVPPGEHPAFYGSALATLNVTREPMARYGFCPSGRLFEAAACGVPLISDEWEGLETFFEPGEEVLLARTSDDVVEALGLGPDRLAEIGRCGRERTLAEHSAVARARELVALLESVSAAGGVQPSLGAANAP